MDGAFTLVVLLEEETAGIHIYIYIQCIFARDNIVRLLHIRFRNIAPRKYAFICNLTARYSIYRVQFPEISFLSGFNAAASKFSPRLKRIESRIVAAFYICNANRHVFIQFA